jgi:hypothetical protein
MKVNPRSELELTWLAFELALKLDYHELAEIYAEMELAIGIGYPTLEQRMDICIVRAAIKYHTLPVIMMEV